MRSFAFIALIGFLSACQQSAPAPTAVAVEAQAAPAPVVARKVTDRFVDFENPQQNALWDKAAAQLVANKLAVPAGDNAVETYLQLKATLADKSGVSRDAVDTALDDMLPYVLQHADSALERNDIAEAMRLTRIVNSIDPKAPALPRLVSTIKERSATPIVPTAPVVQ